MPVARFESRARVIERAGEVWWLVAPDLPAEMPALAGAMLPSAWLPDFPYVVTLSTSLAALYGKRGAIYLRGLDAQARDEKLWSGPELGAVTVLDAAPKAGVVLAYDELAGRAAVLVAAADGTLNIRTPPEAFEPPPDGPPFWMRYPSKACLAPNGDVLIGAGEMPRVDRYRPDGQFVSSLGLDDGRELIDFIWMPSGDLLLVSDQDVRAVGWTGTEIGRFHDSAWTAIESNQDHVRLLGFDVQGRLWAIDAGWVSVCEVTGLAPNAGAS